MIQCSRDAFGEPRVDVKGMHPLVGSFLEQDIQRGVVSCRNLVSRVSEVLNGVAPFASRTGNAHTVTISLDKVTIENLWDDSLGVAVLSPADFRECLEIWLACITTP